MKEIQRGIRIGLGKKIDINEEREVKELTKAQMITIKKGEQVEIPREFTIRFREKNWTLILIRGTEEEITISRQSISTPSSTLIHIYIEHFRQNEVGYASPLHHILFWNAPFNREVERHRILWNFLLKTENSQHDFRSIILKHKLDPLYIDNWGEGCHTYCKVCCHTFNGFFIPQENDFSIEKLKKDLLTLGGLFNIKIMKYTKENPQEFPYIPLERFYRDDSSCLLSR